MEVRILPVITMDAWREFAYPGEDWREKVFARSLSIALMSEKKKFKKL